MTNRQALIDLRNEAGAHGDAMARDTIGLILNPNIIEACRRLAIKEIENAFPNCLANFHGLGDLYVDNWLPDPSL